MKHDYGIYLVTDPAQCGTCGVVDTVREAVAGGVRTVQIRAKTMTAAALLEQIVAVADAVAGQATILVNDRVDAYLAARVQGAAVQGVHIGQDDLPAAAVRAMIGPDAILGLTANTPAHLDAAHALASGTVDYFGVGAIRATATKPDHPDALGADGFAALARTTELPCVAIGGIQATDVAALRAGGASGVAVVSAICAADEPQRAARELTTQWQGEQP